MATIMPQGELIRKAAEYIQENKDTKPLPKVLDDAAMRFNLSPAECERLKNFFSASKSCGE